MEWMDVPKEWLYPASLHMASLVQKEIAQKALSQDRFDEPRWVAGLDTSNNFFSRNKRIFASCVVHRVESMQIEEEVAVASLPGMPYVSGYLAFREIPSLLLALQRLHKRPGILFVDGHGLAHPRRAGIATHLGVLLDHPTIGVAKSLLCGKIEGDVGKEVGSMAPVLWRGVEIARALRTRKGALPLIISPGHRLSLETAVHWVQKTNKGYRLPEPTRQAHRVANEGRKSL